MQSKTITALVRLFPVISLFLFACNGHQVNVPFPSADSGFSAPDVSSLRFWGEKKIAWTVTKKGGIHPAVKKFDINALPSSTYNQDSLMAIQPVPLTDTLRMDTKAEVYNMNAIPSESLQFKTSLIPAPVLVKVIQPTQKAAFKIAVSDLGAFNGYTGKTTICFLKDRNGLIWIGGDAGLDCYDGVNIRNYPIVDNDGIILGMIQDERGRIWAASNKGILMIDLANGIYSRSPAIKTVAGVTSPITADDKSRLLVGNIAEKGFAIIDPVAFTWQHVTTGNGIASDTVYQVLQDKSRNYWVSTSKGINIIQPTGKIFHIKKPGGLNIEPYGPLLEDKAGNIWAAGFGGKLDAINLGNRTITHYGPFSQLRDGFIFQLMQDKRDRIWAASTHGLLLIDAGTNTYKIIDSKFGIQSNVTIGILEDSRDRLWVGSNIGAGIIEQGGDIVFPVAKKNISASFQDEQGRIWLGNTVDGIEIIDRKKNAVTKLTSHNGLSNDFIQSIQKDGSNIWVTTNGGLDIIDVKNRKIEHFGEQEGLANSTIYNAIKIPGGEWWLIGPTGGLDVIDSAKTMIRHMGMNEGLSDSNVLDIKRAPDGLIWVATRSGGVNVIDPQKQTVRYLDTLPLLKGISNKVMLADNSNRVWIATWNGICVVDNANQTITSLTTKQGLSNNRVNSLSVYNNSIIAATNYKVNMITPPPPGDREKNWQIHTLDHSEGLRKEATSWTTDFVSQEGEFWWCDNGVTIIGQIKPVIDTAAKTFITGISVMNQPGYFISKKAFQDKDTLWTADTFYTKNYLRDNVMSKNGLRWDSVAGPFNMPVQLRIPYNQNYLQFQYAQTASGKVDTIWYSYMLEGIDRQWSPVTSKTITENYLNLPPGTYTFKVKSKTISGKWITAPELAFTITPPWWATWWFRVLSVIGIILVIYFIIKERSKKLMVENLQLEQKVNERTMQLKKSLEDLQAAQSQLVQSEKMASLGELTAGIAHEIQNPLNFVNNFSEVNREMIDEAQAELEAGNTAEAIALLTDLKANEEKITHHGKRADAIVKSMLQHSRNNTGQKEPTDINKLCDEYLRLAYHGLRAKDKSFNADFKTAFDETIEPVSIVPQDMGRVLLNLFNNAFYAVSEKKLAALNGYQPVVTVTTKKSGDKVEIQVSDNGNGIPQHIVDKIFQPFFTTKPTGQGTGLGLSLAYDIIKTHSGDIKVETRKGEETTFTITLPA